MDENSTKKGRDPKEKYQLIKCHRHSTYKLSSSDKSVFLLRKEKFSNIQFYNVPNILMHEARRKHLLLWLLISHSWAQGICTVDVSVFILAGGSEKHPRKTLRKKNN